VLRHKRRTQGTHRPGTYPVQAMLASVLNLLLWTEGKCAHQSHVLHSSELLIQEPTSGIPILLLESAVGGRRLLRIALVTQRDASQDEVQILDGYRLLINSWSLWDLPNIANNGFHGAKARRHLDPSSAEVALLVGTCRPNRPELSKKYQSSFPSRIYPKI
jgi:hypothetical protein